MKAIPYLGKGKGDIKLAAFSLYPLGMRGCFTKMQLCIFLLLQYQHNIKEWILTHIYIKVKFINQFIKRVALMLKSS